MWANQLVMRGGHSVTRAVAHPSHSHQERKDAVTQLLSIISIVVQSVGTAYRRSEDEGQRVVQTLCDLSHQALAELRSWPLEEPPEPTHTFRSGVIQETVSHTISRTLRMTTENGRASERTMPQMIEKLTPREKDMLRLIVQGMSNKEIAAALHLTEGTVKGYISHLLAKLNVRSRTQAVLAGMELGLV